MAKIVHGYQYRSDVPLCPCHDPGNYVALEMTDDPMVDRLRCWCGRTNKVEYDTTAERDAFRKGG